MTCAICSALLQDAIQHAAIVRAPVGDRIVGPEESAAWRRAQATARAEVAASVARIRACAGE